MADKEKTNSINGGALGFVREDVGGMYVGVSDGELAAMAAAKKPLAFSELLNRFTGLMLMKISFLRPRGMDANDLMQECSLGLLDAVGSYRPEAGASFGTYAEVCIDNRLRSAMRRAGREKNRPLEQYLELSELGGESEAELSEHEPGMQNPETALLIRESTAELMGQIRALLSDIEYKVFTLYLSGNSYIGIAGQLGTSEKAVDNAIQRVRRKLRKTVGGQNN